MFIKKKNLMHFLSISSVFGLIFPYFILCCVLTYIYMQLEALANENRQLTGQLENALGKIEMVSSVILTFFH